MCGTCSGRLEAASRKKVYGGERNQAYDQTSRGNT